MYTRTSIINKFKDLLLISEKQYICIMGGYGSGKTHILNLLKEDGTLNPDTTYTIDTDLSL